MDPDRGKLDLETEALAERYARRNTDWATQAYSPLNLSVCLSSQERERALVRMLTRRARPTEAMTVLEIGCGMGGNLAELIKLGFLPEKLTGLDLLTNRIEAARRRLPSSVQLIEGDALTASLPKASYDIVYTSTVFSSILDDSFQLMLAERMWSLLKPGGFILWYDFIYNNPWNQDVRGVKLRRVTELFPRGTLRCHKLTLAPQISRVVTRIHPRLYGLLNALPILRTHVLCEIEKAEA